MKTESATPLSTRSGRKRKKSESEESEYKGESSGDDDGDFKVFLCAWCVLNIAHC